MITKFKIYEGRKFIEVDPYTCAVCGTKGDDIRTQTFPTRDYYQCPLCDFEWYSEYRKIEDEDNKYDPDDEDFELYNGSFTMHEDEIKVGEHIQATGWKKLYSEMKLSASEYNL